MDLEKPCGSKTRSKNRYTRKEIEILAKSLHIPDIKKKTLDQLCSEVRLATTKKMGMDQGSHSVVLPLSSLPPAKPKLDDHLTVPTPTPCLVDIERPCGTGVLRKKSTSKPYTLTQLREFWKNECKELPEFKTLKPRKTVDFCRILRKRYGDLMFLPTTHFPPGAKTALVRLAKRLRGRDLDPKKRIYKRFFSYQKYVISGGLGNDHNFETLRNGDLHMTTLDLKIVCNTFEEFDPVKARRNPGYLFNRNNHHFPKVWLAEQQTYLHSLSFENKYRVVGYTFGGDKILNSFLLGQVDIEKIVNKDFLIHYEKRYFFPLALEIYQDLQSQVSLTKYLQDALTEGSLPIPEKIIQDCETIRTTPFPEAYKIIVQMIYKYAKSIKTSQWRRWISRFTRHLTRIIDGAPPAPPQGIYVYRGVTRSDFITVHARKNVFTNTLFMSTSLSICSALKFKSQKTDDPCCLFVVQVLPGTRCLFVSPFSYFPEEEILFAPGKDLFVTRAPRLAPNANNLMVTHFAVVN